MKVAAAAYPLDWLDSWSQFEDKLAAWVADAAGQGADLLVFPEYGAMELATLDGAEAAGDLEQSMWSVADRLEAADAVHLRLAAEYGVHILAGSGPARSEDPAITRPVNRARLITPEGAIGIQDKQILVPYERDPMNMAGGGPLRLFDTSLGKIGVLICYDSEFPLLGHALAEADILLVPSATEARHGYARVRIGAMARALENQCVAVMSSIIGRAEWNDAVDTSTGRGGVFGPPDRGFPDTGVLAEGAFDVPAWTCAEFDPALVSGVRAGGAVRNRSHWVEQSGRDHAPEQVCLSGM